MNIGVQVFIGLISLGILVVCALYPFTAKRRERKGRQIIIEYARTLSNAEINSIRDNLREQGLIGAVIISGAKSVHVWPPPPNNTPNFETGIQQAQPIYHVHVHNGPIDEATVKSVLKKHFERTARATKA